MKKITLLILSITILNGCQSYFEADSKLFESSISRDLNLNEYDLIVKCQHGSLVSELNVEFVNGECSSNTLFRAAL